MHDATYVTENDLVLVRGALRTELTPLGAGGVYLGDLALTRYRPDPTSDTDGYFIYVRDLEAGTLWSAGYLPVRRRPDQYAVRFGPQAALFERRDGDLTTRMVVVPVASDEAGVDLRHVTVVNHGTRRRRLDLTSYAEVVLNTPGADASHPAFSKLFVQTAWDAGRQALVARRRLRSPDDLPGWLVHTLVTDPPATVTFETDRMAFLGRGRDVTGPRALDPGAALGGTTGSVLDAIASLRVPLDLPPGGQATVTFLLGGGATEAAVWEMVDRLRSREAIRRALSGVTAEVRPVVVTLPPARTPRYRPVDPPAASPGGSPARAAEEPLRFDNGYGGFSADGKAYVIRLAPDGTRALRRPPLPWTNVVANERHGFLVTESGAGYVWSVNSRENRLTPWFNDPVSDPYGEALYLRDEDDGVFWSPLPGPVPGAGGYEVRHGFGYTTFRHESRGLACETTLFVPRHDPVRVTRLHLTNRGTVPRRLSVVAYHRLVMGVHPHETAPHVVTSEQNGVLLARNPVNRPYEGQVTFATLAVDPPAGETSFTTDRTAFLGPAGHLTAPSALVHDDRLDGRTGSGLDPCLAFQSSFTIPPGETVTCLVLLGQGGDEEEALRLATVYRDAGQADAALEGVRAFWEDLTGRVHIATPAPEIDLMANGWLLYQNLSCRMWGRSAYYQAGGAFGYRDQLQDAAALVYTRPDLTRAQILLHAAHQFVEGDVMHWWHPPDDRGLRTRFSDDLLWLPYVTAFYVHATGDRGVLDETAPFLTARLLDEGEDEAFLQPRPSGEAGDVYTHCVRAIDRSLTRGAHGLPLMGTGDWNDGMNRVGRGGRGESVWLGFFLHHVLDLFMPFVEARGDTARRQRYEAYRAALRSALNEAGWDGAWYRRAYYDDGTPLGSAAGDECRIDAIAQAWAVLSGVAPPERARQALDALEAHLVDERAGLIRLLTPPFDRTPHDPGYIKGYVPGVRENGGQYTHGALWAVRALAEAGRGDRAATLLRMLSPVAHAATPEAAGRYRVEPYVIAADVYGEPPHVGRGGWTWYTGSAGWMYRVVLESLLGLRLEDGRYLVLRPVLPGNWPGVRFTYRPDDRGTVYHVDVRTASNHERPRATFDGRPLAIEAGGVRVPLLRDGQAHRVILHRGGS
ncbi:hypothetical protein GQ464_017395 [Rhodocaloribacter litoris]|uniref:GH36-type glycosyl hydrolase domain-containing protein n=1 Tax=Rhodocaloribacter litoris TaxID=2558931 RepID=UPI001421851C|nr:glycosyl transferase [Rhodocaloribacter litoris]QXD15157.1 hypothetical protein GQ464_017395 [Rhodocaloribacter litoris]